MNFLVSFMSVLIYHMIKLIWNDQHAISEKKWFFHEVHALACADIVGSLAHYCFCAIDQFWGSHTKNQLPYPEALNPETCLREFVGIVTWGLGKIKIELDAHTCKTCLCKMSVKISLSLWSAKAVRFYESNWYVQNIYMWSKYISDFNKCLSEITFISKLHIILLLYFLFLFRIAKWTACQQDNKQCKTGLHTDTGYPVHT